MLVQSALNAASSTTIAASFYPQLVICCFNLWPPYRVRSAMFLKGKKLIYLSSNFDCNAEYSKAMWKHLKADGKMSVVTVLQRDDIRRSVDATIRLIIFHYKLLSHRLLTMTSSLITDDMFSYSPGLNWVVVPAISALLGSSAGFFSVMRFESCRLWNANS